MTTDNALHGEQAVKAVAKQLGRPLTYVERRVVEEEGFVPNVYKDTKGIDTYGVGQTGEWIKKGFPAALQSKAKRTKQRIPMLDTLPETVQAELIQAEYRGDLGNSPTFLKLLNSGQFEAAAEEFLDNDDYRRSVKDKTGVHKRMERVAEAVKEYGQSAKKAEQAGTFAGSL